MPIYRNNSCLKKKICNNKIKSIVIRKKEFLSIILTFCIALIVTFNFPSKRSTNIYETKENKAIVRKNGNLCRDIPIRFRNRRRCYEAVHIILRGVWNWKR